MSRPRGFTIVELMVVVGIIAVLIALAVLVGRSVTGSSRETLTRDTMKVLTDAVVAFQGDRLKAPPPVVAVPWDTARLMPVADAVDSAGNLIDSTAWLLFQLKDSGNAAGAIANLASRFRATGTPTSGVTVPPEVSFGTIVDAWNKPIRYVHPAFDGQIYGPEFKRPSDPTAQVPLVEILGPAPVGRTYQTAGIRRNASDDADGGLCTNEQPYFYSMGEDGNATTTADNVYAARPKVAKN